jgi:DNA-binding PadR family transcriptional regulator
MQRRRPRSANRALPEVAYLILGHVAAHAGVHGYRLGRLLSTSPLGLPSLHLGQVYRILHELAERGLVQCRIEVDRSRPSRQLFTITRAGEAAFRRWLAGPARGSAPVRDQLLHRLRFGDLIPPASLRRLLHEAVRECEADLADLRSAARRRNGSDGDGTTLLSIALEHRLAADRSWLAEAARFIDARSSPEAAPGP